MVRKYSLITLTPKEENDRKLFWNFKVDEMRSSVLMFTIFATATWVVVAINFLLFDTKKEIAKPFITYSIACLSTIAVYLTSRCQSDTFVYMLIVQRILNHVIGILAIWHGQNEVQ